MREMDRIVVYDNSTLDQRPQRILIGQNGRVVWLHQSCPEWLKKALAGSAYQVRN